MTRVTAPREIARLTRSLSTTAAAPRASRLSNNVSNTAASWVRKELEGDAPSSEHRTITTHHRPGTTLTPNPNRIIPLMQGFHTTHTRSQTIQANPSALDFAVLPGVDLLFARSNNSAAAAAADDDVLPSAIRVPLLPDNFAPARSATVGHVPEVPDAPLSDPEIVVLAADPGRVNAVSALTEVEGMGPDGVELRFVHGFPAAAAGGEGAGEYAGGVLKGIWKGLLDSVSGGGGDAQGKVTRAA
ncbi:hypothetical protein VPNG_07705 [Cytospora leucostoma]|uniref:Uncharacterized protein n=1 Tax=Cytospora leucostoma TaxID=1230097 RepID=A0A423W890_9PEZI|nr:hypothetical protein VPNG_07705 [Cytospora leucostoma]